MADVKVITTFTVKPAGPAWTGTVKLGDWDQMVTAVYVETIYFYRPSEDWAESGRSVVDTVKESLGRALVHFYPYAGRVHRVAGGGAELRCDGQGAEVVESEAGGELAELGDFSEFSKFEGLVPVVDAVRRPIEEVPLVNVQVTRFRCGGVSLGLSTSHGICDGMAAFHFLQEWARLARGEPIKTPPIHDRSLLRAGEPPRGPGFSDNVLEATPPPPLRIVEDLPNGTAPVKVVSKFSLPLSKAQIDKLKKAAIDSELNGGCRPYSRYEVLTAHIWRCLCKAKGSRGNETKALAITLDVRGRVDPPLPTTYFGNAVLMVAATSQAEDLISKPLGFACSRIRETIAKVTNKYIWADIDDFKRQDTPGMWRGLRNPIDLSFAIPELGAISWLTLPTTGLDFGWGDHIHMSPGSTLMEGVTNLVPGREEGSASVVICLREEHVDKFKSYFYEGIE